jgi:hypothetical protein
MAKQRGRPKGNRDDGVVRLDRQLISMAKVLAGHRGVSLPALLSELIRGPLEQAYAQLVREVSRK